MDLAAITRLAEAEKRRWRGAGEDLQGAVPPNGPEKIWPWDRRGKLLDGSAQGSADHYPECHGSDKEREERDHVAQTYRLSHAPSPAGACGCADPRYPRSRASPRSGWPRTPEPDEPRLRIRR